MVLIIFIGIVFVFAAACMFVWTLLSRTFDHNDRLALLPLEDDLDPGYEDQEGHAQDAN